MCETKNVTTAIYIDTEGRLLEEAEKDKRIPDGSSFEEIADIAMAFDEELDAQKVKAKANDLKKSLRFVGKTGSFCPMEPGTGGGILLREKDNKFSAVTGTKGYEWMEAEMVESLGKDKDIDQAYFHGLVDAAIDKMKQFGDVEWFVSEDK